MRIDFQNVVYYNNSPDYGNLSNVKTKPLHVTKDAIAFKQSVPPRVIKYLNARKIELKKGIDDYSNFLVLYDFDRLDGIQNGIKIFEGLNFRQIAHLIYKLREIAVQRGCNNACIYCFADAKTPHYMRVNNFEYKMVFEDYENLINGFGELNKRLGFNPFSHSRKDYKSLFYDADSSMIFLRDKNGKTYDYADLSKMLYDVTDNVILFDTAGWNINDKQTQKRMEDLVQKILNSSEYDFLKFNVSINPFHSIYSKSVELKKAGDVENSEKLREIYTDRMANVIFTLSPLIAKGNSIKSTPMLDFIIRGMKYDSELSGYKEGEILDVCKEILKKVETMLEKDLMSDSPKVAKNEYEKQLYMTRIERGLRCADKTSINLTNKKLLSKFSSSNPDEAKQTLSLMHNSAEEGVLFEEGFLDVNGRFYMTNYAETYPTNIVLNYTNKGKAAAPIEPNLRDKMIII